MEDTRDMLALVAAEKGGAGWNSRVEHRHQRA